MVDEMRTLVHRKGRVKRSRRDGHKQASRQPTRAFSQEPPSEPQGDEFCTRTHANKHACMTAAPVTSSHNRGHCHFFAGTNTIKNGRRRGWGVGGESTDKGLRREWKPFCSDCCSVQTENMAPLLTGLYTRTHVYWVDAGGLRVQSPRCGCAIVLHRQRHCGFSLGLCSNVCIWVVVWQHHGHSWRWRSVPLSCRYPTTKDCLFRLKGLPFTGGTQG